MKFDFEKKKFHEIKKLYVWNFFKINFCKYYGNSYECN